MTTRDGRFVGVDVVDLHDPRCRGKEDQPRFLARVLSEEERALVTRSPAPATKLWRLWAAKEAAYKVVSKVRGAPPPFVHAQFRVELENDQGTDPFGAVRWEDLVVRVHWHELPGRIAAVGWNGLAGGEPIEWGWAASSELDPEPDASLEALFERLSERERRPVHSRGSLLVRLAARSALAVAMEVEEARVEVVCGEGPKGRIPPEVLLDERPAPVDVSLSHHGRWLAWALRMSETKTAR